MTSLVITAFFCFFSKAVSSSAVPSVWRIWKPATLPFEFTYEHRPAWCVDKDPLCASFSGWCISANETRVNYMKKACRRTCHMCYEGMNTTETCHNKDDDCAERENDCYSEATAKLMYHSCPRTCGFCNGVCADLATNCAQLNGYCLYSDWHQAVMRSKCRLTCSFCRVYDRANFEPSICYDARENCQRYAYLCDVSPMQETMRDQCAHTCGYCDYVDDRAEIPTACVDAQHGCHEMKHLCYVTGSRSVSMWRNCRRTCGYCPQHNDKFNDHNYYYY